MTTFPAMPSYHQARTIWWPRWRRRALFILGGLSVGGLAVAMAQLADRAQALFHAVVAIWPWAPFVLAPGGFALTVWLTRAFLPGAGGSGIPQVIAAHSMTDPTARARLVPCGSPSARSR